MNNPARDRALSYLGRFSRTRKQIADYLKRKQFEPDQIADAISYLKEHGYINDDSFAEAYIQEKIRKLDGPLKIRQMLFLKGVDSETGERFLRELYPVEIQQENAMELIQKKLKGTSGKNIGRMEREKILRFVASRGFPRYVIIQAFKALESNKE